MKLTEPMFQYWQAGAAELVSRNACFGDEKYPLSPENLQNQLTGRGFQHNCLSWLPYDRTVYGFELINAARQIERANPVWLLPLFVKLMIVERAKAEILITESDRVIHG